MAVADEAQTQVTSDGRVLCWCLVGYSSIHSSNVALREEQADDFLCSVNVTSITRLALTYTTAQNKDVSIKVYNLTLWMYVTPSLLTVLSCSHISSRTNVRFQSVLEINIGLMCVCALVFPAFWERVLRPQWNKLHSLSKGSKLSHSSNDKTAMAPEDPEYGLKLVQTEGKEHSVATFASSDRGADSTEHNRNTEGHADF